MKKLITGIVVFALVAVLLPLQFADARGGGGRNRPPSANAGGSVGGARGNATRSKKDETQLRELTRLEDADSLRRAARGSRR